jgi:hypothetical protein
MRRNFYDEVAIDAALDALEGEESIYDHAYWSTVPLFFSMEFLPEP